MGPEVSVAFSEQPDTGPYPEKIVESKPRIQNKLETIIKRKLVMYRRESVTV
jgi:hypothetical protein